jgi:Ran GTPase-activating protein (RanGAP) involved in mRNA processing and transport
VTNNQIEILLNLLKYPTEKITKISFNNNFNSDLSEYNIQKILLNLMTYNHDIMSLNFNICENLSNNIISYIIFSVQNLKSIRILSFESCNLNDGHIKVLVEGIKENQTVNTLMLRKNNITSQGAIYISEYINNNKNIKHLYLGNNKINGNGLKEMLKIMTTNNRNITSIDLSNNDFNINDFNALIDYFKTNPILNLLDISGNRIDLQSAVKLGSILNTMKNIKCINMSNMGINSDSTPILFKSAFSNEIILDDNNIEDIGLIMLIKALENNKNLKKLSFKNIKITGLGLTTILQFIDKPRDFKELHLENNKIDDINKIRAQVKDKQYKIYVSRSMVNPESLKDESLANEPNLIFV